MFFKDLTTDLVGNASITNNQTNGGKAPEVSAKALAASSVANGFLLLVTLLIFSLVRNKFPRVYTPRLLLNGLDSSIGKLPNNLLGWLVPALRVKDEEILRYLGLDALMFLRLLRLCFKFGIIILPYGLIVVLPVNYHGGISDTDPTYEGLDSLTMGNVKAMSSVLWVHFIGVWMYTFVILYFLYREYVAYQRFRQQSLCNGEKYHHRYLVMLQEIPTELQSQEKMKDYVFDHFPDQTLNVYVMEDNVEWKKLIDKYVTDQRNLAAAKAEYRKTDVRPKHRPELFGLKGSKVDSISYFQEEIKNLKTELEAERNNSHQALNHCFVAYKSLREAAIGGNGLAWDHYTDQMQARICPEEDDIVWANLKKDRRLRFVISLVMNTVVQFFMIFFWTVPVGVASAMVSFEKLEKTLPFLKSLEKLGPAVTGFISGFLSTVVLVAFFALLPMILTFLAYIKGIQTYSQIQKDVLEKLFVFKVLNQFVLYILGNTMLEKLSDVLDHPSEIPSVMAKEMPSAANFFINLIMLRATTIFGMELLRIVPLILIKVRRKYLVKSSIEDKECWEPPEMWYSTQYAEMLLVFIILISYSVLAPLVIPFAVMYFGFGYVTWLNQLLFVYVPKWEGDGEMWPIIFHRMMVSIIVFLLFMMGLFGLKKIALLPILLLPLLVICIIFWHNVNQVFAKPCAALTFTSCTKIRDLSPDLIEKTFQKYKQNENIPEFPSDDIDEGHGELQSVSVQDGGEKQNLLSGEDD